MMIQAMMIKKTDELDDPMNTERIKDGDHAIDDLDKANLTKRWVPPRGSSSKNVNVEPEYYHATLSISSNEVFMLDFHKQALCDINVFVTQFEDLVRNPGKIMNSVSELGEGSNSKNMD